MSRTSSSATSSNSMQFPLSFASVDSPSKSKVSSSRLHDLLGLAHDSRALRKLSGDYGLDVGSVPAAGASAKNAMRFLTSLQKSYPEILQQNEQLIIATGSSGEEDLRGRQLYPLKDVSRSVRRDSPTRISPHWQPRTHESHDAASSYSPLSPTSSASTTSSPSFSRHQASLGVDEKRRAAEPPAEGVFDDFDDDFDYDYEDEDGDDEYYDDEDDDDDIMSSFASLSKLSSHIPQSTAQPPTSILSSSLSSSRAPAGESGSIEASPLHVRWRI